MRQRSLWFGPVVGAESWEMPVVGVESWETPVVGTKSWEMPVVGAESWEMPVVGAESWEMPASLGEKSHGYLLIWLVGMMCNIYVGSKQKQKQTP